MVFARGVTAIVANDQVVHAVYNFPIRSLGRIGEGRNDGLRRYGKKGLETTVPRLTSRARSGRQEHKAASGHNELVE